MKLSKLDVAIVLFTFAIFIVTCKKNDSIQQAIPPVAKAGNDQTILLPDYTAILKSEGPDNTAYLWRKISGPSEYKIDSPRAKSTKVTNLEEGIYLFELSVTDAQGRSARDTVKFSVEGTGIAPVAIAGPDTIINMHFCHDTSGSYELDGRRSFDPDHTPLTYTWTKLSGPQTGYISNPNDPKITIQEIAVGRYVLELMVRDEGGKTSRDTINLDVNLLPYTLDVSLNSDYLFLDNYDDYYYSLSYYDLAIISAPVVIPGRGDYQVDFYEKSDTLNTSGQHNTSFNLSNGNGNNTFLSGDCSVNFKTLVVTGGGAFSGTINVNNTSAVNCDPGAINKISPVNISGNLDTTTKKLAIRLQGTILF